MAAENIELAMRKHPNFKKNMTHFIQWPKWYIFFIVKRAIRFLPLFFFILAFEWKVLPYLSLGPMGATDFNCSNSKFLKTLFFLKNDYAGTDTKMCSPWLWYLSVDMQLFLFMPILMLIFTKFPKLSMSISSTLAATCMFLTFYICQIQHIQVFNNNAGYWAVDVMNKAYTRGGCYFIGACLFMFHTLDRTYTEVKSIDNPPKFIKNERNTLDITALPSYGMSSSSSTALRNNKNTLFNRTTSSQQTSLSSKNSDSNSSENGTSLREPLISDQKKGLEISESRNANSLIFEFRGKKLSCKPQKAHL